MRLGLVVASLSVFLALPSFSSDLRFERLPETFPVAEAIATLSERIPDIAAQRQIRQAQGKVRPTVIRNDSSDDALVFPAAGSVRGGGGTFFRSDITLVSMMDEPHDVIAIWLPRGGGANPGVRITLPANDEEYLPVTVEDFVGTVFGLENALGSILVYAANPDGSPDEFSFIDGYSRIWTSQPPPPARPDCTGLGSVSQDFPPVRFADSISDFFAFAWGLRQDTAFRTNAGVVNLDATSARSFTIRAEGSTGVVWETDVTVPPLALVQVSLPTGQNFGHVYVAFEPYDEADYAWSGYASTVDNGTGDGWVSHAKQP